jgi:REP element-mobilizing transposase RayT
MNSDPLPNRRPGPPHNPGVRNLVRNKRAWDAPANRAAERLGFRGWHERGYLPHRDSPRLVQFVTCNLVDAFPAALRSEWQAFLKLENERERRQELEDYLDRNHGECWLRRPEIAALVEGNWRYFHPLRYELRAWCVMPNHIHVLFRVAAMPMSRVMKQAKSFTANEANKLLQRDGAFWMEDYFDTCIRSAEHEKSVVHYIENNPVKARLVREARQWPWSSARFRDEHGQLLLPAGEGAK